MIGDMIMTINYTIYSHRFYNNEEKHIARKTRFINYFVNQ